MEFSEGIDAGVEEDLFDFVIIMALKTAFADCRY